MIRTNLATRPFYNERAVQAWLLIFLAIVMGATAFNVSRVLRYSRSDTELNTRAARDESQAADLRTAAARLRRAETVKAPSLLVAVAHRQAMFASAARRRVRIEVSDPGATPQRV